MGIYSLLLGVALGVSAPWWLWRMATSGRYRAGLAGRLGALPRELREAVAGSRVVWVHAVSVGEVLAVERLVGELRQALNQRPDGAQGKGWVVVLSTTTATGQAIARQRLPGVPVFYLPLDFAWAVRRYLRMLRPALLVLVESEFWPRLLMECGQAGVRVAVVNARVSDRSFPRYMRLRWLWKRVLGRVAIFLAQGEESAGRLRALGVERVRVVGNLKFDLEPARFSAIARRLRKLREACRVIVAGSTHEGEEQMLLAAWPKVLRGAPDAILVLAPRHPQRFAEVIELVRSSGFAWMRCSELLGPEVKLVGGMILVLDTIGDLASIYSAAQAAFIGGSLVPKGGHNPLEAARFGVPIVMGESYENFREIVEGMGLVRLVREDQLGEALISTLMNGRSHGRRGKEYFEAQAGATGRTVAALLELLAETQR